MSAMYWHGMSFYRPIRGIGSTQATAQACLYKEYCTHCCVHGLQDCSSLAGPCNVHASTHEQMCQFMLPEMKMYVPCNNQLLT